MRKPIKRSPCQTNHAIVLASWEKNSEQWLDGHFFELRSKKPWLQETVGNKGTLWVVVSRRTNHGCLYTLSFKLECCRPVTYSGVVKFGRYAVIGDSKRSKFFAGSDARLLLLALRFDPFKPIKGPTNKQVSNSLRVPRCLCPSDIALIRQYAARSDRWSVFISYERGKQKLALELSEKLQVAGLSVFRDLEGLRGGDKWWPTLRRAIKRSKRFLLLVTEDAYRSKWVKKEARYAQANHLRVIPVLAGGNLLHWDAMGIKLSELHALDLAEGVDLTVNRLINQ